MRMMCGAGAVKMGTRSWFRGGIPSESPDLNVPFLNDLMALTQASLVLYTKLPSIQLVILFIYIIIKKLEYISLSLSWTLTARKFRIKKRSDANWNSQLGAF